MNLSDLNRLQDIIRELRIAVRDYETATRPGTGRRAPAKEVAALKARIEQLKEQLKSTAAAI